MNKKILGNKGFTVIELLVSLLIMTLVVLIVIKTPADILVGYQKYKILHSETTSLKLIDLSIKKDIELSKGDIREVGDTLYIGDVSYNFTNDGVKRIKELETLIIPTKDISYSIESNFLNIYTDKDKKLKLKYNTRFDSFQNKL